MVLLKVITAVNYGLSVLHQIVLLLLLLTLADAVADPVDVVDDAHVVALAITA